VSMCSERSCYLQMIAYYFSTPTELGQPLSDQRRRDIVGAKCRGPILGVPKDSESLTMSREPNKSLLHPTRSIRSAKMRFIQLLLNTHGMLWFLLNPHANLLRACICRLECLLHLHACTLKCLLHLYACTPKALEYLRYTYKATRHACKVTRVQAMHA
jgi:hypothetical protein